MNIGCKGSKFIEIGEPVKMPLCDKAQSEFNAFVAVPVVPIGQLYGGKIFAALDRQHPRDLFDVKYLLENEGFSEQVRDALAKAMRASITRKDKEFLLSVYNVTPNWSIYDYERFPAVQWKLQNLQKLKTSNPDKHREQYEALKDVLEN